MHLGTRRPSAPWKPRMTTGFLAWRQLALAVLTTLMGMGSALAASSGVAAQAQARYRNEMAHCNSGQSHQNLVTCRQEAGAAWADAKRNDAVQVDPAQYQGNALQRCAVHQGDDRLACEARIVGQGDVTRDVEAGGLLRQSITVTPAQ